MIFYLLKGAEVTRTLSLEITQEGEQSNDLLNHG
jgi:hypothetical protein